MHAWGMGGALRGAGWSCRGCGVEEGGPGMLGQLTAMQQGIQSMAVPVAVCVSAQQLVSDKHKQYIDTRIYCHCWQVTSPASECRGQQRCRGFVCGGGGVGVALVSC